MKKRALVTGGAGFIGSHLCKKLLTEGLEVICMDNLITGAQRNVSHFLKDRNFRFIKHDVSKRIDIKGRLDYVLHFASPASPADYLHYPIQTLKAGSLGTHNALGLAKKHKATFVLASTSEVYGDPLVHPQPESYWGNVNCVGVRGCYDEGKRFAEALTMAYHNIHKIDIRIARIFNTYGPCMRLSDGRVIPNFIAQALSKRGLTVYGNGRQIRSFCYVSDLIDGIYRLMLSNLSEPVNLGNSQESTILKLAKLIIKLTVSKSRIVYRDLPQDDPKTRCPDINLAMKMLNWKPQVSLENGLRHTIEWFSLKEGM